MNDFGENLKRIRGEKKISQGQLAKLMGIHPTHISRYERNLTMPSIDVAKKFASILEISLDMLVYGSTEEKAKGKINDVELLNMFAKTQNLNENDKDCIKTFLKAFLFQKNMEQQLVA